MIRKLLRLLQSVRQDKMQTAVNHVGVLVIYYPQKWKVWRRGKRFKARIYFAPASELSACWQIPYGQLHEFMMASRFGEAAAIGFAETYGRRRDLSS